MITISFKVDDKELRKKLTELDRANRDLKPVFDEIGQDLEDFYGVKVFQTQGAALGKRWKPLAPPTVAMRAARAGYYSRTPVETNKILTWTGNLRNSFKRTVEKTRLIIENTATYFKFHQLPGPKQRKVLGINAEVITIVLDKFQTYFNDSFKK